MGCEIDAVCFAALDPARAAAFWGALLGREVRADRTGATVAARTPLEPALRFHPAAGAKTGPNRMHLDLTSSSLEDQRQTVARALALGGRHIDVGQRPEEGHVVLADPEGDELCVVGPGNRFLAGCGAVGALSCDGTRAVGLFWAAALGWPLVWDQDEETAVQSPQGGTKISWGGPPVAPATGRGRVHLDLVPSAGCDREEEVERLLALGARRDPAGGEGPGHVAERVALLDPDGNGLCVLARAGGGPTEEAAGQGAVGDPAGPGSATTAAP